MRLGSTAAHLFFFIGLLLFRLTVQHEGLVLVMKFLVWDRSVVFVIPSFLKLLSQHVHLGLVVVPEEVSCPLLELSELAPLDTPGSLCVHHDSLLLLGRLDLCRGEDQSRPTLGLTIRLRLIGDVYSS